jgi:Ca2+-binding RTX toxin-like protein
MAIKNGTAGADTLTGTAGADQLFGKDGNDILKGLAGPDLLNGGSDRDTADYSRSADFVIVNLNDGAGFAGDAEGDTYVSIENLFGSSLGDFLHGDNLANVLNGGLGNDLIIGGGGNDTLLGGGGNDKFVGGTSAEVINGGGGRLDTLSYELSKLGVNVNLSTGLATGGDAAGDIITGVEDLIGSVGDDVLGGSIGINSMQGGAGDDRLFGFAGNDVFEGNKGADAMSGGDGTDMFVFSSERDSPSGFFVRDVIRDFSHAQRDHIDLHLIDANAETSVFDSFEFLGRDALVDAPGQITYGFEGNTTVVLINTEGGFNSPPEMEIQLQGHIDLAASDFIF